MNLNELNEFAQGCRQSLVLSEQQAKAITPMGLVIEPGTEVDIGRGIEDPSKDCIPGTVLKVCIEPNFHVTYEVLWWSGKEAKTAWFPASLVRSKEIGNGYRTIGLIQPPTEGQPGRPITG